MIDIRSFSYEELVEFITSNNEPKFRAKQIYSWLHKGISSFDDMKNIPKSLISFLKETCTLSCAECVKRQVSKLDGTRKYLLKFNDGNCVEAVFSSPITDAFEVRGDETKLDKAETENGKLYFNLTHNEIKSFAINFQKDIKAERKNKFINLKYNSIGITSNKNRSDSTLNNGISVPLELIPERILSGGIEYSIPITSQNNCLVCDGSKISIDNGYNNLHLLITSLNGDKTAAFKIGEKDIQVTVPDYAEALGYWDLMQLGETGYIKPIPQALAFSHTHCKDSDILAKQFYVFHVEIPLCDCNEIILPDDKDILIFAATATTDNVKFIKGDIHFDSLEKREFDYEFSDYAKKLMNPNKLEKMLDRFIDREFNINVKAGEFYHKYSVGELYYILRNLKNKTVYQKNVNKVIAKRKKWNNK